MEQLWAAQGKGGPLIIQKNETHFSLLGLGVFANREGQLSGIRALLADEGCTEPEVPTPMRSGEFYRRIWRGPRGPAPDAHGDNWTAIWISTVRATRMLYEKMEVLFTSVEPDPYQDGTYGFLQREILILACTEVESAWRAVLEVCAAPVNGTLDRWTTADYVRLVGPMRLDEYAVSLSAHRGYRVVRPFKGWDPEKPTQSLPWYNAYNAVKHGREDNLDKATLGHVVDAVAAAFVIVVAQFGSSHIDGPGPFRQTSLFHPDAFNIVEHPTWLPTEVYIPPYNKGLVHGEWLGHEKWTPVPCPAIDESA